MFSRRKFLPAITLTLALCGPAYAQQVDESAPPEVENSRYQFIGVINGNDVAVRSGPSEGHYATATLANGTQVTVVGIKLDWLKILPPEGSFSYVAKAFVEKRGDGSIGRVMKSDLNVRAGSNVSSQKNQVQTRLAVGDDVRIIGEQDEYFKIQPPAGAFLYINKRFVEPVRALNAPEASVEAVPQPAHTEIAAEDTATDTGDATFGTQIAESPAIDETATVAAAPATTPPADPAATVNAEQRFDTLEDRLRQTAQQDLSQQPIDELLTGYTELAADVQLPDSMRRIAESRVDALKIRQSAQAELATLRKDEEARKQQQMALKAEEQEIQEVLDRQQIKIFTAVGILRPSSLQDGQKTLYRITDPTNGRTLVYIRTSDERVTQLMGQFIGVNGSIGSDPDLNLQVVRPDTLQPVNPAEVGNKVAAQFAPPSLVKQNATASVPEE